MRMLMWLVRLIIMKKKKRTIYGPPLMKKVYAKPADMLVNGEVWLILSLVVPEPTCTCLSGG